MGERPALFLGLLADQPELIAEVGVLRWREWADGADTPGAWIELTAREAGRDELPVTLVAMDLDGHALGAVALGGRDDALSELEAEGRSPWLLGMVVRADQRLCGVGRLLVSALEDIASDHGYDQVWVATGDDALEFYRHCGWRLEQRLVLDRDGRPGNILTRQLTPVTVC